MHSIQPYKHHCMIRSLQTDDKRFTELLVMTTRFVELYTNKIYKHISSGSRLHLIEYLYRQSKAAAVIEAAATTLAR